jgi:putative copper resistance protein D
MSDLTNEFLVTIRAIHFAATLSTSGTIAFWCLLAEPVVRKADAAAQPKLALFQQWFARLVWSSLAATIVSGLCWVAVLAAQFGDRPLVEVLTTGLVPSVLVNTRFGHLSLVRLGLCVALAAALRLSIPDWRGWAWWQAGIVAVAAGLAGTLAWSGHGGATEGALGNIHLLADVLHLCAAAAWLGGLLPLALLLRTARMVGDDTWAAIARNTTRRFSVLGLASVGALIASGALQAWLLAGSVPGLIGTTYGRLLLLKIALFAAMISLAAVNRLRLTPQLSSPSPLRALRTLERNSLIELGLGLGIIAIVGALGTLLPAAHSQAWWPFGVRYESAIFGHPTLLYRTKAIFAVLASVGGVLFLIAGLTFRILRWPALLVGVLGVSFIPECFRLLTVPAYPTSFYASPTGYTVASVVRGKELFAEHCAVCHGPDGRGEVAPPKGGSRLPDLTADHIYAHRDGDVFWWITNGIRDAMPGLAASIDEEGRWNLIDFVHANADAAHVRTFGANDLLSVSIPNFACETSNGVSVSTSQLRGRIIYITVGRSPPAERIREFARLDLGHDATKVLVTLDDPPLPDASGLCIARDPAVAAVFASYRGGDLDQLDGTSLVVDAAGFLRAMQRSQSPPAPALIREIRERPALPRSTSAGLHSH